jgi:hypothetical protein
MALSRLVLAAYGVLEQAIIIPRDAHPGLIREWPTGPKRAGRPPDRQCRPGERTTQLECGSAELRYSIDVAQLAQTVIAADGGTHRANLDQRQVGGGRPPERGRHACRWAMAQAGTAHAPAWSHPLSNARRDRRANGVNRSACEGLNFCQQMPPRCHREVIATACR